MMNDGIKQKINQKYNMIRLLNNKQYIEYKNDLELRKKIIELIMIILSCIWLLLFLIPEKVFAQQHPTVHNDIVFFVESLNISDTQHIAYCETEFCLNHPNTEGAIIAEQYCDVSNSCGEGCVRRWLDQSNFIPTSGFNPPEYTNGRDFGQDDAEKPCYIIDCLNGKPCVRGGGPYDSFGQDKYLELQISDFINLPDEFSIFLLAKPIDQTATGNWYYFGQSSHFLRHNVSSNNLQLRVPGNFATSISEANSIILDNWHLIEIHRDVSGLISVFIDGENKTINNSTFLNGNLQIGYLFSNFKTTSQFGQTSMYGDIAAFLVFDRKTTDIENDDIREYFNINYLSGTLGYDEVISLSNFFELYPNPTKNSISIKNKSNSLVNKIHIYDLKGRLIKQFHYNRVENEFTIDVSNLSSSIYQIVIYGLDNQTIKRFVKH